jgi:hypothetical protein
MRLKISQSFDGQKGFQAVTENKQMTEAKLCRALTEKPVSERRIILDSAKRIVILETRTPFKIFAKKQQET